MALLAPDQQSCKQKKKCLGGANHNLAYDPDQPCPDGFNFNEETCDCESQAITESVRVVFVSGSNFDDVFPGKVLRTVPAPFFQNGKYVTFTISLNGVTAAWSNSCGEDGSIFNCTWGTNIVLTKTGNCSGGTTALIRVLAIRYEDGVYKSFEFSEFPINGISQCGSPIGTSVEMNVKYQKQISPGNWVDFSPGG